MNEQPFRPAVLDARARARVLSYVFFGPFYDVDDDDSFRFGLVPFSFRSRCSCRWWRRLAYRRGAVARRRRTTSKAQLLSRRGAGQK